MNISKIGNGICQKARTAVITAQTHSANLVLGGKKIATENPAVTIGTLGALTGIGIATAVHSKENELNIKA